MPFPMHKPSFMKFGQEMLKLLSGNHLGRQEKTGKDRRQTEKTLVIHISRPSDDLKSLPIAGNKEIGR